jgi:hypothetical protein
MKMNIPLREPDPKFAGVARTIGGGDPPKWLVAGLTQFSPGIGSNRSNHRADVDVHAIIERMLGAIDTLITWLPAYKHFPFGLPCPDDVTIALGVLPQIKKDLNRVAKVIKSKGRRPDAARVVCAAVVTRAWKIVHGQPSKSRHVQEACCEYWRACGGKQIGGWDWPENWRRTIDEALTARHSLIEDILLAVQNAH